MTFDNAKQEIICGLSVTDEILRVNYFKRGYSTHGPYFLETAFSQKIKQCEQNILWIRSEMFQGTQKSQFYFSRDYCCEVIVKNV